MRFTLSLALETAGYKTTMIDGEEKALDLLQRSPTTGDGVAVLVVNFDLANLEGVRLVDKARRAVSDLGCLIIYSFVDKHALEQIVPCNGCVCIERPFRMRDFLDAIKAAMRHAPDAGAA